MANHPWGERKHGGNNKPRDFRPCRSCGRLVAEGNLEMDLCSVCVKPPSNPHANNDPECRRRTVSVLKCPHNIYRDATFTTAQFKDGLKSGIWPLGMIVRTEYGRIRAVCGKGRYYRDPGETLPRQWLRAV